MANPRHSFLFALCALAFPGAVPDACGQSVNWGAAISLSPARHLFSSGQPVPGGTMFELGYFDEGFDPAAVPAAQWRAHWHPVDCAQFVSGPVFYGFTATANMSSAAADGKRAWIWGWNAPDLAGFGNGEILLAGAPGWLFPSWQQLQGGAPSWTFRDAELEVLAGSVTRGISGQMHKTGSLPGISVPALSSEHEIQFATWTGAPAGEAARIRLLDPAMEAGGFRLRWEGVAGYTHYQVEYSADLQLWRRDLPGSLVAGGGQLTWLDASSAADRRFYRILPACPP